MEHKSLSTIRPATGNDLKVIAEIEQKCFPGPIAYPKSQLAYLLLHGNSTTFVETCGDTIRGFVMVTYRRGSQTGHIETIDVDPAYTKLGIGLRLLTAAEKDMQKRGKRWAQLEVSEGNKAAIKLYEKAGYMPKERIKNYYMFEHNGTCDAMRMVKAL